MTKKRKWTKDECERRYVHGAKISLNALSKESGVNYSTLKSWSSGGQWKTKREEFQVDLNQAAREKTIDKLSTDLAQLEIDHVNDYSTLRGCAMAKVKALKARLDRVAEQAKRVDGIDMSSLGEDVVREEAQAQAEAQGDAIRDSDVLDLQALANVVDKCIRGERMVLGAEYEDLNKAVAAITRAGLEVKAPNGKVLAQLAHGQASESGAG